MLLRVVYLDGNYDLVNGAKLTTLIDTRAITMFKRSEGWIHIDSPKIRKTSRQYWGSDKRAS